MTYFDSTYYTGKPAPFGHPLYLTDRDFWRITGPNQYDKTRGDEARTRELARKASGQLLCLDIEHWPLDIRQASDADVERSMGLISEIIDWIRDEAPNVRLGLYGILPLRDYWTPVIGKLIPAWMTANGRLRKARDVRGRFIAEGLADKVDCVFPSLYAFYDDVAGWETYAKANIAEARVYGKQVYAFLMMHYHDSNAKLKGQLVPLDFWQRQLDVCRDAADGAVIWGGWQAPWSDDVARRMELVK